MNKFNIPTNLIILGATGDLMKKKIVPALFNLFEKDRLPKIFRMVGYSRRKMNDEEFRKSIREILSPYLSTKELNQTKTNEFINSWFYHQGNFDSIDDYQKLANNLGHSDSTWKVCSNKLFYIAAPPTWYKIILNNLHNSDLTKPCSPEEGFTRVLIEKPFGRDYKTAEELEILLGKLFKEIQIYRIDHYLAKEMLQNILTFRFSNNLFEPSWNNCFIEKVEIRLWEALGVEKRGTFYDGLGALRDVGQNHLLQMLALITMDNPCNFTADAIRRERAKILSNLAQPSKNEIQKYTFRAQYKGYTNIADVNKNSKTETYFKIRAFINTPRWTGVPFILESGKRLDKQIKEIVVIFKNPVNSLNSFENKNIFNNKITFQLEPKESVFINLQSKKPGLIYEVSGKKFDFMYKEKNHRSQYVEEYEKLILDAINGDQTLFISTAEVKSMWKFVDPIIEIWKKNKIPLKTYTPDTNEPIKESDFININIIKTIPATNILKKEIGIIGLGKMGGNLSRRLISKNWRVVGFNRTFDVTKQMEKEGLTGAYSLKEFMELLSVPRIIWLMLPAGDIITNMLFCRDGVADYMNKDDIVIDGSNSYYKDTIKRYKKAESKKIKMLDAGVSGGPGGALNGACIMAGGDHKLFEHLKPLFLDMTIEHGVEYVGAAGAGHFVKMIHNGIEYGMMQAIAEGFTILKKSDYKLDLKKVTDIYNHGSVIESRLIGWLKKALVLHGEDLSDVSPTVAQTGEGLWTAKIAGKMKIEAKVIEESVDFRKRSSDNPSYTGRVLSALREQFGGHKA